MGSRKDTSTPHTQAFYSLPKEGSRRVFISVNLLWWKGVGYPTGLNGARRMEAWEAERTWEAPLPSSPPFCRVSRLTGSPPPELSLRAHKRLR